MINKVKELLRLDSILARSIKGGFSLLVGSVFGDFARLLRNILLARIIAPEHFGMMAIIMSFIQILEAIAEIGIRQAVIQDKNGHTYEYQNVAFWFSVVRGVALFSVGYISAPAVANFYELEELTPLLRIAYLSILFKCIASPGVHVLEKSFKFKPWVMLMQGAAFASVLITIGLAFYMKNVWALLLGSVSEYLIVAVFSFFVCPFMPSLKIHREYLRSLYTYAKRMFGLPILAMVFFQADIFVAGKMLSMNIVGMYSLAKYLSNIPRMLFIRTINPLLLPAFSEMQANNSRLKEAILKTSKVYAFAATPLLVFTIIYAREILTLAYGVEFAIVAVPFAIICVLNYLQPLSQIIVNFYLSKAMPHLHRTAVIVRAIVVAAIIYPLTATMELNGVALSVLSEMVVGLITQLLLMRKILEFGFREYLAEFIHPFIVSTFVGVMSLALLHFFKMGIYINLTLGACVLTVVTLAGFYKYGVFGDILRQ
jgi:O-antigen/teichoic acid export membrane protein